MEIASFVDKLNEYIQKVNEVDEETISLLAETISSAMKLQMSSKLRETTLSSNESVALTNDSGSVCQLEAVVLSSNCSAISQTKSHGSGAGCDEQFEGVEHVSQSIARSESTSRMIERCSNEAAIVELLVHYSEQMGPGRQVVPFGSATYGFGDSMSNFNILIQTGERSKSLELVETKPKKSFNRMLFTRFR